MMKYVVWFVITLYASLAWAESLPEQFEELDNEFESIVEPERKCECDNELVGRLRLDVELLQSRILELEENIALLQYENNATFATLVMRLNQHEQKLSTLQIDEELEEDLEERRKKKVAHQATAALWMVAFPATDLLLYGMFPEISTPITLTGIGGIGASTLYLIGATAEIDGLRIFGQVLTYTFVFVPFISLFFI